MTRLARAREWRTRTGEFRDCERDTVGREQVMPGKWVDPERQTHNKAGGTYRDGDKAQVDS